MAATPTVVWKSLAICGSSESVTRTCAWAAKPAAANSRIERVGTFCAEAGAVWSGDSTARSNFQARRVGRSGAGTLALTLRAARVS